MLDFYTGWLETFEDFTTTAGSSERDVISMSNHTLRCSMLIMSATIAKRVMIPSKQ
jgi:hypothetical protein